METRHQFIVSSDRLKDPGIKPAVPSLKERTHAVNTNCFRLVKQQCGLITDPAFFPGAVGQKFNNQTQHNIRFTDVVSFVYI